MLEFILMIAVIVFCVLIFGKADSKRTMLNTVGLDLSESKYQNDKEEEFAKYCKKSMKTAISEYDASGKDEREFLERLDSILYYASTRNRGYYDDIDGTYHEPPSYSLHVYTHYTKFAEKVVSRRINDMRKGSALPLLNECNYMSKQDLKRYVDKLWDKYQYPWPDDWLIKDGI